MSCECRIRVRAISSQHDNGAVELFRRYRCSCKEMSGRRNNERQAELRREVGRWLRKLRTERRLSQAEVAGRVGAKDHAIISRIENGRLGVPADCYLTWAHALGVKPRWFVQKLMSCYDPVTYEILFKLGTVDKTASRVERAYSVAENSIQTIEIALDRRPVAPDLPKASACTGNRCGAVQHP